MAIEINIDGFIVAEALLKDSILLLETGSNSTENYELYKLLKARQLNPDFEFELAEFICGESNNNFPYRSSFYLTKFFTDLGFDFSHDGSSRRYWVRDILLQLSVKDLSIVIERGLFNRRDFRKEAREKKIDHDEMYRKAIQEFQNLINESFELEGGVDLAYLLDFNINTELLFNKNYETFDIELNKLIKEAKNRFFIPKDKQIAIEKLWDAFERIKTYFDVNKKNSSDRLVSISSNNFDFELINNEFHLLTTIGNEYRIRHHETNKREIKEIRHLNYLFFRMLCLMDLCLASIQLSEK